MHKLQLITIPALVALSAIASADIISGGINGNACPSDWTNIQYKNTQRCCYGSLSVESDDPYCCVHSFELSSYNNNVDDDITSDCYPFCTGTLTRKLTLPTITKGGSACKTKIAFKTDDYSSLVSAASASVTGTKSSDSDATTTATTTATGSDADKTTTKKSETSTNMAGPMATAEGLALGGVAMAAALFAL